jgi:hypothetical protein
VSPRTVDDWTLGVDGEQWVLVEPVLRPACREDNCGHPWYETSEVLNGCSEYSARERSGTSCRRRTLPFNAQLANSVSEAASSNR